jgi:hypothetical protein
MIDVICIAILAAVGFYFYKQHQAKVAAPVTPTTPPAV